MAPSLEETILALPNSQSLKPGSHLAISQCCSIPVDGSSSTPEEIRVWRNPSLQVTADHKVKVVDAPILKPGKGEVLLHIKVTGICGYDCPVTQSMPRNDMRFY